MTRRLMSRSERQGSSLMFVPRCIPNFSMFSLIPDRAQISTKATPILDGFIDRAMETRVVGSVENETTDRGKESFNFLGRVRREHLIIAIPVCSEAGSEQNQAETEEVWRKKKSGNEQTWIDLDFIFSRGVRKLAQFVEIPGFWILLDEWSTVPGDIQPYLADLVRRAMFSVPNISVKIAAI